MLNKIKCSITYSRMVVAKDNIVGTVKDKVNDATNYVKEKPVQATVRTINLVTTNSNPASLITHACYDCIIKKAINK